MSDSSLTDQWHAAAEQWPSGRYIADEPFWTINDDGSRTISLRPAPPRPIPLWRRMLRRLTPWWIIAVLPLLIIPVGLLTAPDAAADPVEDYAYIHTLDQFGVYYSSRDAAVAAGHSVCTALDAGYSITDIAAIAADAGGYSQRHSAYIIGAAIGAYCPEHKDLIEHPAAETVLR